MPMIGHNAIQYSSCFQAGQMLGHSVTEETFGKYAHQQTSNICKQFSTSIAKLNMSREMFPSYSAHRELKNKTFKAIMSVALIYTARKLILS